MKPGENKKEAFSLTACRYLGSDACVCEITQENFRAHSVENMWMNVWTAIMAAGVTKYSNILNTGGKKIKKICISQNGHGGDLQTQLSALHELYLF